MWKLAIALALLLGLAAATALVPLRGRTVLDRWNASHGVGDFVERGYREAKVALGGQPQRPRPGRTRPARPPSKQQARSPRPATPTEDHSDADRAAVDRIIAEHAAR
jgi:hypothetical protein